jgi:hypothetical protein
MTRRIGLGLLVAFFTLSCFAQDPHSLPGASEADLRETQVELVAVSGDVAAELARSGPDIDELRRLNEEVHEALEGDGDHHAPWWKKLFSLKSWRDKFNFRRTAVNASRWFALRGGDVRTHEHVVNLILMYGGSHFVETALGSATASWAVDPTNATHWAFRTVAGVAGVTVIIPGLDPLCLGLGYLYWRFPLGMHRALTPPRFLLVRMLGPVTRAVGIEAVASWAGRLLVDTEQGSSFLRRVLEADATGIYRWNIADGRFDVTVLDANGFEPLARLDLSDDGAGRLVLEFARFWPSRPLDRRRLAQALAPFGYNVRTAVLEVGEALTKNDRHALEHRVYIADVIDESDGTLVRFRSPAIRLGARRRLRPWVWTKSAIAACGRYLAGSERTSDDADGGPVASR